MNKNKYFYLSRKNKKFSENSNLEGFHGNYGAGILFLSKNTNRFLILKRSNKVHAPGTWSIPGGAFDPLKEKASQAAKRECLEETGYDCNNIIDFIPSYTYSSPENTFKYYNFIATVPEEFEPNLNEENRTYRWLDFEELLDFENKHFGLEEFINNEFSNLERLSRKDCFNINESNSITISEKQLKSIIKRILISR